MKVRIKNIGPTAWAGRDYDGRELRILPGEAGEMSQRRADKVLADYPSRFALEAEAAGRDAFAGDGATAGALSAEPPAAPSVTAQPVVEAAGGDEASVTSGDTPAAPVADAAMGHAAMRYVKEFPSEEMKVDPPKRRRGRPRKVSP